MFGTASKRLDDEVIRCFRADPSLTADDIHRHVSRRLERASSRAVYKSLNRLLDLGVLAKRGTSFSLRLTWILEVMDLSATLFQTLTENPAAGALIPRRGERLAWTFHSLSRLDSFWVELMLALFLQSSKKHMFQYVPHAWFSLIQPEIELQTVRAMNRTRNRLYTIIGSDSYLDRQNAALWAEPAFITSFAESPYHGLRNTYFNIIDDFVLKIVLDGRCVSRIERLFESTKKKSDIDASAIIAALGSRCQAKLTLEQNEAKAAKYRRVLHDYWGVS